jgi:hypothetical protein
VPGDVDGPRALRLDYASEPVDECRRVYLLIADLAGNRVMVGNCMRPEGGSRRDGSRLVLERNGRYVGVLRREEIDAQLAIN